MKKVLKRIFIYLGVIILAITATIVLCAAFLFFYRDGNIFGFKYVSVNDIAYAREEEKFEGLQTIQIDGYNYPVTVSINDSVEKLSGAMRVKTFGYTHKSKFKASFNLEYDETTGVALFKVGEPGGWLNKRGSQVVIALPESYSHCDIIVKTNKGDVTIGGKELLEVGEVSVTSVKGKVVLNNISISDKLDLDIGKGTVVVNNNCLADYIDVNIKLGNGKVYLDKIDTTIFNINNVNLISCAHGDIYIAKAKRVITDEEELSGGNVAIATVEFIHVKAKNTNFVVKEITGITACRFETSGQGKIAINKPSCPVDINAYNGDVKVTTPLNTVLVKTNQGDILIEEAVYMVDVTSVYGDINVAFSSSALDYDDNLKARAVVATTKNGHINISGLQKGNITSTEKGRITLNYNKVVGENVINTNIGNVYIVVPAGEVGESENALSLELSTMVNADVRAGVVDWYGSGTFTQTNIYNDEAVSTSNILKVTGISGIVKIRSADLV